MLCKVSAHRRTIQKWRQNGSFSQEARPNHSVKLHRPASSLQTLFGLATRPQRFAASNQFLRTSPIKHDNRIRFQWTQNRTFFSALFSSKEPKAPTGPSIQTKRQLQQVLQWFYKNPEKNLEVVPQVFLNAYNEEASVIAYQHFLGKLMQKYPSHAENWIRQIIATIPANTPTTEALYDDVLQACLVAWSTKPVQEAVTRIINDQSLTSLPKSFIEEAKHALETVKHPVDYVVALSFGPPLTLKYLESVLEKPENDWIIPTCWMYYTATLDSRPFRVLLKLATQEQVGISHGIPNEEQLRDLHRQLNTRAVQSLKHMAYLHQPEVGEALTALLTTDKFILKDTKRQDVIREVLEYVELKNKTEGKPKDQLLAPWF